MTKISDKYREWAHWVRLRLPSKGQSATAQNELARFLDELAIAYDAKHLRIRKKASRKAKAGASP